MKTQLLILFLAFFIIINRHETYAQGAWTQKKDFGSTERWCAVGFSIGNKGYIGTGINGANNVLASHFQDFWEWDQATNVWTQKADFGGGLRNSAVGFSIGNKGYIGTGARLNALYQDFWEWDGDVTSPTYNTWKQKTDLPGVGRWFAEGFSIGNKGYIGLGTGGAGIKRDFWEWDPATNLWTPKANLGGAARYAATGFSIGNKGYLGIGWNGTYLQDFWEWDPVTNVWTQKADYAGIGSQDAVGFSIGNKGYIGTGRDNGCEKDFWEWDPATNVWVQMADFGGAGRQVAVGFSIGTCGYLGTGSAVGIGLTHDFWEWSKGVSCSNSINILAGANVCAGSCATLTANHSGVISPYTYSWNPSGQSVQTIIVCPTVPTTYTVVITDSYGITNTDTALVGINLNPTANAGSNINIVVGNSATLNASGGGTYNWSPSIGLSCITCQNPVAMPLTTTEYCVTVIDSNGCLDNACVIITIEPINCSAHGELYLPNAFSPNDDGENDRFCLPAGQGSLHAAFNYCIKDLAITIYDRWGEKVYESNEKNFCWDGRYKDKLQNTSVFVYYMNATLIDNTEIIKQGNISLVR